MADSGLLLLHGLDRETLGGANWRRRVVLSPQFHENHVLTGPLLQQADLTILDESFGALDPQNLELTLKYVLDETSTLLVIAHP